MYEHRYPNHSAVLRCMCVTITAYTTVKVTAGLQSIRAHTYVIVIIDLLWSLWSAGLLSYLCTLE